MRVQQYFLIAQVKWLNCVQYQRRIQFSEEPFHKARTAWFEINFVPPMYRPQRSNRWNEGFKLLGILGSV